MSVTVGNSFLHQANTKLTGATLKCDMTEIGVWKTMVELAQKKIHETHSKMKETRVEQRKGREEKADNDRNNGVG